MISLYRKDVHQIYDKGCLWEVKYEGRIGLGKGTKRISSVKFYFFY